MLMTLPAPLKQPVIESRVPWIDIGAAADLRFVLKLWDRVYRFRYLAEYPDHTSIYFQMQDVLLSGRRNGVVHVIERAGVEIVEMDRRRLRELQDLCGWLYEVLCEDHTGKYAYWENEKKWVMLSDMEQPMTELCDAERAADILDVVTVLTVDNVVQLVWECL